MDLVPIYSHLLEPSISSPGAFCIKNTKTTDEEIEALTASAECIIVESRAPLSLVTPSVLSAFISIHGPHLQILNLQNSRISSQELSDLAPSLPNLKVLFLQYLNAISDGSIMTLVGRCHNLEEIHLSQNRQLTKGLFYFFLGQDRSFSTVSLDLTLDSDRPDGFESKAKINKLTLIGRHFVNQDALSFSHRQPDVLELRLTRVDGRGVSDLLGYCKQGSQRYKIIVTEMFSVKLMKIADELQNNNSLNAPPEYKLTLKDRSLIISS